MPTAFHVSLDRLHALRSERKAADDAADAKRAADKLRLAQHVEHARAFGRHVAEHHLPYDSIKSLAALAPSARGRSSSPWHPMLGDLVRAEIERLDDGVRLRAEWLGGRNLETQEECVAFVEGVRDVFLAI